MEKKYKSSSKTIWIIAGIFLLAIVAALVIKEQIEYARIEEQRQTTVYEQQLVMLSIYSAPYRDENGRVNLDYAQVNYASLWVRIAIYNECNNDNITVDELLYAFIQNENSELTAKYFSFYYSAEHEKLYMNYRGDLTITYSSPEFLNAHPEYKNIEFGDLKPEDMELLAAFHEQTIDENATG